MVKTMSYYKPPIWELFIPPIKMVMTGGMAYDLVLTTSEDYMGKVM